MFKFNYNFEYAQIQSKTEIETFNLGTPEPKTLSELECVLLTEGTKIGVVDPLYEDIDMLITIKTGAKLYSEDGKFTDDEFVCIEISPDVFISFHEPIDLVETEIYDNYNEELEDITNEYGLNHFIVEP